MGRILPFPIGSALFKLALFLLATVCVMGRILPFPIGSALFKLALLLLATVCASIFESVLGIIGKGS